ncbi:hypothetical protein TI39_contig351g00008 [Zymoseptoria brevis]|uniref:F-box domain-containing protein n=1 Tax=Zymoseptoria brevis TaxID=1047168 RepID=A0A0F4GQV7_9PEZI|nr:hypothetical protein TI39_contig351g00008 [Zymoseptoria brevis]
MEQSPTLLGLPVEMFQRIAEITTKDELMCLRLVSRECAAKVLKVYKEVLFSEQRVMLSTNSSIRNAIEVIDHPVFGGAIRRLVLVDNSLREPHVIDFTSHETDRKESAYARLAMAAYRAQNSTWTRGEDLRLLTILLRKYGQVTKRSIIHLGTISQHKDERSVWGENGCVSLDVVLRAVVASQARFGTFSMDNTVTDGICPVTYGQQDDAGSQLCATAFRDHFQDLALAIEAWGCPDNTEIRRARHFFSAISQVKLRSVRIVGGSKHVSSSSPQESTIAALMSQEFSSLESLEFGEVGLDWGRLVHFLTRQRNLRELRFSETMVSATPEALYDATLACDFISQHCGIANVTEDDAEFDW